MEFNKEETDILNQYFTNTTKPVFGLINMPEVVKGALYARYSRSPKSLRRLFLDEFYNGDEEKIIEPKNDNKRAEKLYDKVFVEYGDDSVAQLGGAHIACEGCSNILVKVLERGRLASYLEQSTRYVYYDDKVNNKYKYSIPEEIIGTDFEKKYSEYCDKLFSTYSEFIGLMDVHFRKEYPQKENQSIRAYSSTIKAKSCDIARNLLPASTKTNMGIFASGQSYEWLLVKMFASNNKEVQSYAFMMLEELRKIIPAFMKRVDLPNRGKLWSNFVSDTKSATRENAVQFNTKDSKLWRNNNLQVEFLGTDSDALNILTASIVYESSNSSYENIITHVKGLQEDEKIKIISENTRGRKNRRHKPDRGFEDIYYSFEITSDYGSFRDLQRHRMMTLKWQNLSTDLGFYVPHEIESNPLLMKKYHSLMEQAFDNYHEMKSIFGEEISQYIVPFGFNIRYFFKFNARQAFHLIELRTQKQGHTNYRIICQKLFHAIKARHPFIADLMSYTDLNNYEMSREDSEISIDKK